MIYDTYFVYTVGKQRNKLRNKDGIPTQCLSNPQNTTYLPILIELHINIEVVQSVCRRRRLLRPPVGNTVRMHHIYLWIIASSIAHLCAAAREILRPEGRR